MKNLTAHSKAWLALVAAAVVALGMPAAVEAKNTITVMTRNLFLGADLTPAISAAGIPQSIDGAGVVFT